MACSHLEYSPSRSRMTTGRRKIAENTSSFIVKVFRLKSIEPGTPTCMYQRWLALLGLAGVYQAGDFSSWWWGAEGEEEDIPRAYRQPLADDEAAWGVMVVRKWTKVYVRTARGVTGNVV